MTVLLLVLSSTYSKKMPTKQEIMYQVNADHDGKLLIGEKIDENSIFKVFSGKRFGMLCAVKVYKHEHANSETHEATILQNLQHLSESRRENLLAPEIYDALLINGYQVIIMESGMPFEEIRKHELHKVGNVCFFIDLANSLKNLHIIGDSMKRDNSDVHKMTLFMQSISSNMIKFNSRGRLIINDYSTARSKITVNFDRRLGQFVEGLKHKTYGQYQWETRINYAFYHEIHDLHESVEILLNGKENSILRCFKKTSRLIKKN